MIAKIIIVSFVFNTFHGKITNKWFLFVHLLFLAFFRSTRAVPFTIHQSLLAIPHIMLPASWSRVEALRLYRDILRTCKLFTWKTEKGEVWCVNAPALLYTILYLCNFVLETSGVKC